MLTVEPMIDQFQFANDRPMVDKLCLEILVEYLPWPLFLKTVDTSIWYCGQRGDRGSWALVI